MSYKTKILNYFRSRDRGWLLSLLAAASMLYLPFLGSPFVFDDLLFFFGGVAKQYGHSYFHFGLRWLPYASLGWTEQWFSNVVTHFFHLGNLLLHVANVILLFYLLRLWTAGVEPEGRKSSIPVWGAWFGALVFALHPVAVYAVGYVIQRSILMATCFSLIMQLAYWRGLLTGQVRWLALAAAAYFMAVFAKEHGVMTLALLAAETILLRGRIRATGKTLGVAWAIFMAIALIIILRAKGVFGLPYEPMAADLFKQEGIAESSLMLHLLSILTQAGLFFKYLLLWILPNPAWMSIDMRESFVTAWLSWHGLLGITGFLGYGILGVWLLLRPGRTGLIGMAMLYPWLQFLIEFSSIRIQEPFVLYRSYLWMPGTMLLIALVLIEWPSRKTFAALGLSVVLLLPLTLNRLWVFADTYRLWNDAVLLLPDDKVPGADRILFNRGQAEEGMGRLEDAIADFKRVVAISPQYAPVRFELGWVYGRAGRYEEAMGEFDAAIATDPNLAGAYYGKALLLRMRHEDKQAAELMAKSCKLKNAMACLFVNKVVTQE